MNKIDTKILEKTAKVTKRKHHKGTLMAIGGHEDISKESIILRIIAKKIGTGKLVVLPFGSEDPEFMRKKYTPAFRRVGIKHLHFLNIEFRSEANNEEIVKVLNDASGVFICGGDQHKINTLIGSTLLCESIREIYNRGGVLAGTSAGASVLSETMLVYPEHVESDKGNEFELAPGLSFMPRDILIDQHFSQRKRFGRILSVVAKNPRLLGIGLDENTAVMLERNKFKVIGEGLAYVFDGSSISFMNLERTAYDMKVHIMSEGYEYDLNSRIPIIPKTKLLNKTLSN